MGFSRAALETISSVLFGAFDLVKLKDTGSCPFEPERLATAFTALQKAKYPECAPPTRVGTWWQDVAESGHRLQVHAAVPRTATAKPVSEV